MFKQKIERKKKSLNLKNLDSLHQEKVNNFIERDIQLNKNNDILLQKKSFLDNLEKKNLKSLDDFKQLSQLKYDILDIQNKQSDLNTYNTELTYYFDTYNILEKYYQFDTLSNKQEFSIDEYITKKPNLTNKNNFYVKYLEIIKPEELRKKDNIYQCCDNCNLEMILDIQTNLNVCSECGAVADVIIDSCDIKKDNYMIIDNNKYSVYQRRNHFKEWLNQIQAKETTEIPQEIIDMITLELKKLRITNLAKLNATIIRKVLKKLNLSKYYENTYSIINKLNGLPPPTFTIEKQKQLINHFLQIEEPFKIFKSSKRKNILRYSYILYKLCELLELDEYLHYFKLLKNRSKLIEQDEIWKKICEYNQWQFISSI